jgi:hypothetical protein
MTIQLKINKCELRTKIAFSGTQGPSCKSLT